MRRPRRDGPNRDFRTLSREQEEYLTQGRLQLLKPPRPAPFASDDDARAAWRIHGPRILEEWTVPNRDPRGLELFGEP